MGCLFKTPVWRVLQKWLVHVNQALLILAILIYPLVGLLKDREPAQLEWFAMTPAPTLTATLALLLFLAGHFRFWLVLIPTLWSLVSVSFAWELKLLEIYAIFFGFTRLVEKCGQ